MNLIMEFSQQGKAYLLSEGYTQGATKTTENNYQKGRVEVVVNETSFEHRQIVAGNVAYKVFFKDAELYQLKQAVSQLRGALFLSKSREQ